MAFISSHTIQLFAAMVGMAHIPCTLSQSRLCVHIQYSSTVSHDDGVAGDVAESTETRHNNIIVRWAHIRGKRS